MDMLIFLKKFAFDLTFDRSMKFLKRLLQSVHSVETEERKAL